VPEAAQGLSQCPPLIWLFAQLTPYVQGDMVKFVPTETQLVSVYHLVCSRLASAVACCAAIPSLTLLARAQLTPRLEHPQGHPADLRLVPLKTPGFAVYRGRNLRYRLRRDKRDAKKDKEIRELTQRPAGLPPKVRELKLLWQEHRLKAKPGRVPPFVTRVAPEALLPPSASNAAPPSS
jgi:hypothetical protein